MIKLLKKIIYFFSKIFWIIPLDKTKVFLMNFDGTVVGHDAKAFVEWCNDNEYHFKFVWAAKNKKYSKKMNFRNVTFVSEKSLRGIYEMLTAKTLIYNINPPSYICFRKQQELINTWHGFIIKLCGKYLPEYNKKQFNTTTCFLSDAEICTKLSIREAFEYKGLILNIGTPRTDCFFSSKSYELKMRVKDHLNIDESLNIVLYAPTFRGNFLHQPSSLDFDVLKEALSRKFGGKWIALYRLHPMIAKNNKISSNGARDVSLYEDTQELLCASDVLITDYSSIMWDFALQYRPVFVFAEDIEDYKKSRGLTIPIEDLPFTISTSNKDLAKSILDFDDEAYRGLVKEFYDKMGNYDLGNSCQELLNYIIEKGGKVK